MLHHATHKLNPFSPAQVSNILDFLQKYNSGFYVTFAPDISLNVFTISNRSKFWVLNITLWPSSKIIKNTVSYKM